MIAAIASDYAGAAGANPTITVFDELWGYARESASRLWDEMIPPPTRRIACRLTVSYAGFLGESDLLEGLYKRGMAGEVLAPDLYSAGGLLCFWTHEFTAPWQTEAWREQMREASRPNAYLRQIENRWVTSESPFIDMDWWDACTDPEWTPRLNAGFWEVFIGVDASVKRDSTAVVTVAWEMMRSGCGLLHTGFFSRVWRSRWTSRARSRRPFGSGNPAIGRARSGSTRIRCRRARSGWCRPGCRWSSFRRRRRG